MTTSLEQKKRGSRGHDNRAERALGNGRGFASQSHVFCKSGKRPVSFAELHRYLVKLLFSVPFYKGSDALQSAYSRNVEELQNPSLGADRFVNRD